jgi:hypothetical protein
MGDRFSKERCFKRLLVCFALVALVVVRSGSAQLCPILLTLDSHLGLSNIHVSILSIKGPIWHKNPRPSPPDSLWGWSLSGALKPQGSLELGGSLSPALLGMLNDIPKKIFEKNTCGGDLSKRRSHILSLLQARN